MQHNDICQRIQEVYPHAEVAINGVDCSFEIAVTSDLFAGMSSLSRQRSIMSLFQPELQNGTWHALTIKTRTPAEIAQQT